MNYEDTYAVLEFQGYVRNVPTYDRENKILRFVGIASTGASCIQFYAKGELAKAYKSILHQNCIVQIQATPSSRFYELDGKRYFGIQWHALRITLLGKYKVRLGRFDDKDILDSLSPIESDFEDVGHVDYESWTRFQTKRGKGGNAND